MGQEANCQVSHEGGRGGQKKNVKENHVGQEADRHLRRVKTGGPTWAQASQEAWPRSECPMPRKFTTGPPNCVHVNRHAGVLTNP